MVEEVLPEVLKQEDIEPQQDRIRTDLDDEARKERALKIL